MANKLLMMAIFVVLFASSTFSGQDPKKALQRDIQSRYKVTKTSRWEPNNVTEPGTVFVVQKEGLAADLAHDATFFTARVLNGEVSQRGGAAGFFSKKTTRRLKVGDRVYATSIEVKDDRLRVLFLTRDMYEVQEKGNTTQSRYKGGVDFEFEKSVIASMDLDTAIKTIEAVLTPEEKATAVQTKTISLGQTEQEVETILGKPDKIINLGQKVTWVYKDIKVIFVDGKVVDIQ